jgi:ParB family chromosome partitioning protein
MSSEVRGLGRGLGALLGAELSVSPSRGAGTLPLSLMRPGAFQPRRDILKEPLEELAASIKANGVLQPIVIRALPPGQRDGVRYEIIAGERRWQAAKLAGLKDIPAIVRELSDREAALVALIENIQREELTSAEEARAFKRLVDEFALTHQEIADLVGRSRAAVTNLMRLLELPPEIVALIDERALAMGHARALLGLESDEDRRRVGQLVADRECSVRETEQLVRKAQETHEDPGADGTVAPVVSELLKTKTLHVQLHQRAAGSGKLVVKFADPQSRDALVAAIRQIAEL